MPEQGAIEVGGKQISEISPDWLRSKMSVVPQDTFLFNVSIRDNLTLGQELSDAELQAAIQAVGLTEVIERLPSGLDALIGQRGATLSGGERQRVCIARALLRQPDILVLDESTSALDIETEGRIWENLRKYRQAKTTIVISHRLAVTAFADTIVVMNGGVISARGTQEQVLNASPWYAMISESKSTELKPNST
jgi:ABC-type multidrug transport system fused ATPase/permease subunit